MKRENKVLISVVYSFILSIFTLILGILELINFLGLRIKSVPSDVMGGFSLIVASTLILYGSKKTIKMLYDGLSFYLVGLGLLIAIGLLHILITLADILDYYIMCIGESCIPYSTPPRPEIYIFFFALLGLYPYFARWHFRRDSE